MEVPASRDRGGRLAAAAGLLAALLAGPSAASGQIDVSELAAQVAVDSVVSALVAGSPRPSVSITAQLVTSNAYFAEASGTGAVVSTRFGREASRHALAAALARDLYPDPVYAAITLHRGGFDGPGGLAELHGRVAQAVQRDTEHQQSVAAAWEVYRVQANLAAYNSVVRDGYRMIYLARVQALRAQFEQVLQGYWAFRADLAGYYAMRPVPAELVRAVAEITAVLRGDESTDASPWGPRIKAALDTFPK